jgi:hypothetical protein
MTPKQYKNLANKIAKDIKYIIKDMRQQEESEDGHIDIIEQRLPYALKEFEHSDEGSSRMVFISKSEEYVIKVNKNTTTYGNQNRREWERWNKYKSTIYKDILAPCLAISDDRMVLLQAKVRKCNREPNMKQKMNMGIWNRLTGDGFQTGTYDGKVVVYDYGY